MISDIYYLLFDIRDPEFNNKTLEDLKIIQESFIRIESRHERLHIVTIQFKPTAPHCKSVLDIGLAMYFRLNLYYVKPIGCSVKFIVQCIPGTHNGWFEINRQLRDKERVSAALENPLIQTKLQKYCEEPTQ